MPKVIKKKPPKKKPVQEDEVKSAAYQALDVIKEKQKVIIIGVTVIAVIVILFIGLSLYSTSQYKKAGRLQVDANRYYYASTDTETPEEERLQQAIDLYQQSLDIKATPMALFYLGNTYVKQGDYENAKKEYNRFINEFSRDELILPLVYQKLASVHFKLNENDQALEAINKLAVLNNGIFRDTALILEARYHDTSGDADKALAMYQEIVDTFPTSPWSAEAASKVTAAAKEDESPVTDEEKEGKTEEGTAKKPAAPVAGNPSPDTPETQKSE